MKAIVENMKFNQTVEFESVAKARSYLKSYQNDYKALYDFTIEEDEPRKVCGEYVKLIFMFAKDKE